MFRQLTLIVSLIIFSGLVVSAQQPWTLQQCIDQALKYNIQIKQSSLNNDLNKVQVTQNTASMFPSINGNATQDYNFGRFIDPQTNTYTNRDQQVNSNNFSLSGNLTLFEGLQLQNNLKESKLSYLASQNDLKKIKNDISINVVNFYLQVLFNEDLMKISLDQMNASGVQRDRMKRMYDLGSVNKGNYLDLESQFASDEVKYIQAQSQYTQSLLSLTQLLELDTLRNFTIEKPEVIIPVFDSTQLQVDRIYQVALKTQPDVKSSEYKTLSSEKKLSSARGALYPRIFLNGTIYTNYSSSIQSLNYSGITLIPNVYSTPTDTFYTSVPTPVGVDKPFNNQFNDNLGKAVGFTMQVPIFNGWSSRSNIARSKINLEQSRLNNELTRKNIYKSVQQAVVDASSSYKKFIAGQRSLDALIETFNYNQQRMDLGMINTYDYLFSKNNLANAQANLLQAKYDYIFKIKILDFYQGKPLTF